MVVSNGSARSLTEGEPRRFIPANFWEDGWLSIIQALPASQSVVGGDNFGTEAYRPSVSDKVDYVDIHFGPEVMDWLRREAEQYRGRRKP